MRRPLALALLATLGTAVAASDDPKAYACTFAVGVTYSYDKGKFAPEQASPLSFGIAAIDTTRQSADLLTGSSGGTGHLRVVQAVNALHFIEVVTEGFLNITTVYDKDEARGAHPAVHSRHLGLLGTPIVTQYHGFCAAKG